MACDITKGRAKQCKDSLAGTSKAYFINFVENSFTVVNGVATAMNPLIDKVFKYDLTGETNNLAQSMVGERTAGTSVNTQTLTLALQKITKEDNHQMNLLVYSYPIVVVADRNNNYHVVGISEGVDFTAAPTTGAAKADFNGYNLTGVATEGQLAPLLSAEVIQALLGKVVTNGVPSV
jgi:hypothetical protein